MSVVPKATESAGALALYEIIKKLDSQTVAMAKDINTKYGCNLYFHRS